MSTYSDRKPIPPSQKAAAALSIISHESTIPAIVEETGVTAMEVERWVCIIRECAQELFSNYWGEQQPRASISKNDLVVLQKQLQRLNTKIARVMES